MSEPQLSREAEHQWLLVELADRLQGQLRFKVERKLYRGEIEDIEESARQLRRMAEVAERANLEIAAYQAEVKRLNGEKNDLTRLLSEKNETANTFMNQVKKLQNQQAAYNRKTQDWRWRLNKEEIWPEVSNVVIDMESFMRERSIPLEKPTQ